MENAIQVLKEVLANDAAGAISIVQKATDEVRRPLTCLCQTESCRIPRATLYFGDNVSLRAELSEVFDR